MRPREQAGTCNGALRSGHADGHSAAPDAENRLRRAEDGAQRAPAHRRHAPRSRDGVSDGGERRARGSVGADEPRLEPRPQPVVPEAEEVHRGDVRIALGGADELAVDPRLRLLARHGHILVALVAVAADVRRRRR